MPEIRLQDAVATIRECLQDARYDEAIARCRHVLAYFPESVDAHEMLGEACLEKGMHAEAVESLQRTLSVDPETALAHVGLALIFDSHGRQADAIWHLERAFDLAPGNTQVRQELLRLYTRRDGAQTEGLRLSRGAMGRVYAHNRLFGQAIAEYEEVLRHDPSLPDIRMGLAECLWREGRYSEAAQACLDLLASYPSCLKANLILGQILMANGREDEAQNRLAIAQRIDPENRMAEELMGESSPLPRQEVMLPEMEGPAQVPAAETAADETSRLPAVVEGVALAASELPAPALEETVAQVPEAVVEQAAQPLVEEVPAVEVSTPGVQQVAAAAVEAALLEVAAESPPATEEAQLPAELPVPALEETIRQVPEAVVEQATQPLVEEVPAVEVSAPGVQQVAAAAVEAALHEAAAESPPAAEEAELPAELLVPALEETIAQVPEAVVEQAAQPLVGEVPAVEVSAPGVEEAATPLVQAAMEEVARLPQEPAERLELAPVLLPPLASEEAVPLPEAAVEGVQESAAELPVAVPEEAAVPPVEPTAEEGAEAVTEELTVAEVPAPVQVEEAIPPMEAAAEQEARAETETAEATPVGEMPAWVRQMAERAVAPGAPPGAEVLAPAFAEPVGLTEEQRVSRARILDLQALLWTQPGNYRARIELARRLALERDWEGTLAQYEELIAARKMIRGVLVDLQALVGSGADQVQVYRLLGDTYMELDQIESALEMYRLARQLLRKR